MRPWRWAHRLLRLPPQQVCWPLVNNAPPAPRLICSMLDSRCDRYRVHNSTASPLARLSAGSAPDRIQYPFIGLSAVSCCSVAHLWREETYADRQARCWSVNMNDVWYDDVFGFARIFSARCPRAHEQAHTISNKQTAETFATSPVYVRREEESTLLIREREPACPDLVHLLFVWCGFPAA